MPLEGMHIGYELGATLAGRRSADPAVEIYLDASVAALIWAYLQQSGSDDAVEARPIKAVIGLMHLAGNRGHQGHGVIFAVGQGGDGFSKGLVIDCHSETLIADGKREAGRLPSNS